LYILVKVEVRYGTNISPQRHRTALKDEPIKVPKLYAAIDFVIRNVGISSTITDNYSSTYPKIFSPFSLANINIVKDALVEAGFKDIHINILVLHLNLHQLRNMSDLLKQ